ncbi:MAG: glycosyltransferase family 39 protein [Sphingobacteriales bacterium]|nr:glycosyltransferase family 39 protein [Sphingobacteriales bacterium]
MAKPFLPDHIYKFLFALLGLVYITGLWVPLMDNDSAHHANIALHMHLTGDYVNLVDHNGDYLDKPHLLFWLAAFSYKIFGVTSFAYKFPSLLFTILAVYSTFRLAKILYNKEVGKLSALILASAFAFMLANNDVRMEAMLTGSIAFATWQLAEFIKTKKLLTVAGAALGLALGFSTKGMIAVFVPAIGAFFYILYGKDYKIFLNRKWLLMILMFAVFILPVLYCYYQQFNLHPEKIVRGKDHINGIKFILLNQSVERFGGQTGDTSRQDHLFFLHSFLWAFAPWAVLVYIAVVIRIKKILRRETEWLTTSTFIILLLLVSFSGFKLPHYLNIIFPVAAVMAAALITNAQSPGNLIRSLFIIQLLVSVLLLLAAVVINAWAFPLKNIPLLAGPVLLLAIVFYFLKSNMYNMLQRAVLVPVAAMIVFFFLLNTSFYPQLLKYQGGNMLAVKTREKVDPGNVYFWKETQSSSFNFYTKTLRKQFADSVLQPGQKVWLLYDIRDEAEIKQQYTLGQRFEALDYEITKIDIKFVNPEKRESRCSKMVLGEVYR